MRTLLLLLSAVTTAAAPPALLGFLPSTTAWADILSGTNLSTALPVRDVAIGRGVFCTPPMCSIPRAYLLATSPDQATVVMLGADVSGSGAPLQMVPSPWTDPAAVVLAGMLPTSAIDDLTFVAAGRGVDGNGDDTIEVGFLSVLETQSQFELLFVLGGSSYTYVLDSPAALTNISGSGGGMSEIVSYMKLLALDASGQLASYIVALNLSAQNAAFCEEDKAGRNLATMDYDPLTHSLVGISHNVSSSGGLTRRVARLQMHVPPAPPSHTTRRLNHLNTAAAECTWSWTGAPALEDHPIVQGGVSALANRTLTWLAAASSSASVDAISVNADTGALVSMKSNVCAGTSSCYVAAAVEI